MLKTKTNDPSFRVFLPTKQSRANHQSDFGIQRESARKGQTKRGGIKNSKFAERKNFRSEKFFLRRGDPNFFEQAIFLAFSFRCSLHRPLQVVAHSQGFRQNFEA